MQLKKRENFSYASWFVLKELALHHSLFHVFEHGSKGAISFNHLFHTFAGVDCGGVVILVKEGADALVGDA
jgi:hypothetical protein